jgi:hypothetical protein
VKGHPDFLPDFGVNLVTRLRAVNAANDHDWVMKRPFANNLPNTATAGQGKRGAMGRKRCLKRQNSS